MSVLDLPVRSIVEHLDDLAAINRDPAAGGITREVFTKEYTQASDHVAESGIFLHTPQSTYPLIRVLIPVAADVYPEISAGKHRISIRFMALDDVNQRNAQAQAAIPFRLQLCSLRLSHDQG